MQQQVLFILCLSILLSCTTQRDRIVVPVLDQDFYSHALSKINDDLASDQNNLKLVEQKIYYCDILDWPETCINALDELKRQEGMTPQLLDQYVTYYQQHDHTNQLIQVVERWAPRFQMESKYAKYLILGYINAGKASAAYNELENYLSENTEQDAIAFAAASYKDLSDTVLMLSYFHQLDSINPTHELILNSYPELLFSLDSPTYAFDILTRKSRLHPDDFEFHSYLSSRFELYNRNSDAREVLKNFIADDSTVYRLSALYVEDLLWDSAHYFMDILIDRDSLNRNAWFTKATMYENRGWLTYSLNYYDHLLYLNPMDSIAIQRRESVQGKIAYLQRLKLQEQIENLPVLESIKINDNE